MPLLGNPLLFDSEDNKIVDKKNALTWLIERARETVPVGLGVNLDLFAGSGSENNVCRYDLCIGTKPGEIFIDFMGIQFGRNVLPFNDIETFRMLLSIGDPFEAFLAENNNDYNLNAKLRQNRILGFSLPALIRGVHFLGRDLVNNLGGMEKCLELPAHTVECFRGGVIIRLTPGLFDPTDPSHLRIQKEAMKYFGMEPIE
jgi:hypothetical protein